MATLKRHGAYKNLAKSKPQGVGISDRGSDGLEFGFTVNDLEKGFQYRVSLTHVERDELIAQWASLEKDFLK